MWRFWTLICFAPLWLCELHMANGGSWELKIEEEEEEEGGEFGGVLRMWEGEVLDCFDDHRIALESTW